MLLSCLKRCVIKCIIRRRSSACSLAVLFIILILFMIMNAIWLQLSDPAFSVPLSTSYERNSVSLVEAYRYVRKAKDIQEMIASVGDLGDYNSPGGNHVKRRKFMFVLRHYEQFGMSTNNLLALLSAAKYKGREVVLPFVNNSRFSGLPQGAVHSLRTRDDDNKFAPFNFYFDLPVINRVLANNGYSQLASFRDFQAHCTNRLNVVVHFLYEDKSVSKKSLHWFDLSKEELRTVKRKAKKNNGWITCPFIKRARIAKLLDMKVSRYVCVDPEVIRTVEALEKNVLNGSFCVGIVFWKGNGTGRTHFPLNQSIKHRLTPSNLKHNPFLIKIAEEFVEKHLHEPFISVHVRAERHLLWKGFDVCLSCIKKLARAVRDWENRYSFIQKIFLATDLVDYGSDSLLQGVSPSDRSLARHYLIRQLGSPVTLTPPLGLYDRGALAIIEMHILAAGKLLFTVGGGNFQEWVMDLFAAKNKNTNRIHRLCILR